MITIKYGRLGLFVLLPSFILSLIYFGYYYSNSYTPYRPEYKQKAHVKREKAAFVVLARNSDLADLRSSMQMMEDRFNKKYNYPWVFLNDKPFDNQFKELTTGLASGKTYYGTVSQEMWGYPSWIDKEKADRTRKFMGATGVIYGDSESYRHMCRFQSGFFFRHPLLNQFDYYWRVEPNVKFSCDVDYDPFKLMRERDLKYGFTITLPEFENTIPTLWKTTQEFIEKYPQHIIPFNSSDSLIDWISDDHGETYNLCHFWSNFEIASLAFLRSKAYLDYFNYLDRSGGFFYERWGDAPVHSIAAALMLKKSDIHFFYDIGYAHTPYKHCPSEPSWLVAEKCSCSPEYSIDVDVRSCTPRFLQIVNKQKTDFVITKRNSTL